MNNNSSLIPLYRCWRNFATFSLWIVHWNVWKENIIVWMLKQIVFGWFNVRAYLAVFRWFRCSFYLSLSCSLLSYSYSYTHSLLSYFLYRFGWFAFVCILSIGRCACLSFCVIVCVCLWRGHMIKASCLW